MIDFFKEIEYVSVKGQHHFEQIKNSLTIQLRGQNVERMLLNEVLETWLIRICACRRCLCHSSMAFLVLLCVFFFSGSLQACHPVLDQMQFIGRLCEEPCGRIE